MGANEAKEGVLHGDDRRHVGESLIQVTERVKHQGLI